MARTEIKIGGFGGQGVILTGFVIGKAASLYDGKDATMTQAFGPEARGSACSAGAAVSAIATSKAMGAQQGVLVDYYTSYEILPDDSFVGYAGIIY